MTEMSYLETMGWLSLEKRYPSGWRAAWSEREKGRRLERSDLEIHSDSGTVATLFCFSLEGKASHDVEFWLWGSGELR